MAGYKTLKKKRRKSPKKTKRLFCTHQQLPIAATNRKLLREVPGDLPDQLPRNKNCKCRGGPVNCLDAKVKYQATVVEDGKPDQHYVGVTEPPWKKRYGGHKSKMRHCDQRVCSSLAAIFGNWRTREGLRGQVDDPPAAHHLQLHQQLLSHLSVREIHHHVSTRAGHPEPEGSVLHAVHAQDEQAPRQDMIFILVRKLWCLVLFSYLWPSFVCPRIVIVKSHTKQLVINTWSNLVWINPDILHYC